MLKLPTHNRYEYSRIEKRRDFSWPEGKRLAFYIALNVEDFAFMAGRGNDPYLRSNSPQTQRNYAWRDYGLRVGIGAYSARSMSSKCPPPHATLNISV